MLETDISLVEERLLLIIDILATLRHNETLSEKEYLSARNKLDKATWPAAQYVIRKNKVPYIG